MRRAARSAVATLLLFAGCGPGLGTVTGKVAHAGKPVALGTIALHHEGGRTVSSPISEGVYRIAKVPPGRVQVTVVAHPPAAMMLAPPTMAASAPPGAKVTGALTPGDFIPLPEKYADPKTSGESFEVVAGDQTHDVNLP